MPLQRIAISALFAAGLAALPLSAAKAQYYGPPCTPFPLTWPFCVAGAVVGTAATIVSAPFRGFAAQPYYYPGYGQPTAPYYPAPAAPAYAPGYYPPAYYYPQR